MSESKLKWKIFVKPRFRKRGLIFLFMTDSLGGKNYSIIFHFKMIWFNGVPFSFSLLHDCYFFRVFFIAERFPLLRFLIKESMTSCLKVVWCLNFYIYMPIYMSHMDFDYKWSYDGTFFSHSPFRYMRFLLFLCFFRFVLLSTRLFNGTLSILLSRQSTHAFASGTQL